MVRLLYLLIFLPALAQGQGKWIFNGNQFSFHVSVDTNLCDGSGESHCPSVKAIDIYDLAGNTKIQTIIPAEFEFPYGLDSSNVFNIEDMNFDGYDDIRLVNWASLNMQTTYWYWFFNKTSGRFVQDSSLEELNNPYFDHKNKTIHSWWRQAFYVYGHSLHRWKDDKLELIIEQEETWGMDTTLPGTVTMRRMVDGVIREQESEAHPLQTINYQHDQCNLDFALKKGGMPCDSAVIFFKNASGSPIKLIEAVIQGTSVVIQDLKDGESSAKFYVGLDGSTLFRFSIYWNDLHYKPSSVDYTTEENSKKLVKGTYMYTIDRFGKGLISVKLTKMK